MEVMMMRRMTLMTRMMMMMSDPLFKTNYFLEEFNMDFVLHFTVNKPGIGFLNLKSEYI